jgi:hypothetical protein
VEGQESSEAGRSEGLKVADEKKGSRRRGTYGMKAPYPPEYHHVRLGPFVGHELMIVVQSTFHTER